MALGEIEKSKNVRSSKTGFLFFLLLQMSLLSKVWPDTSTVQDSSTTVQDSSATVQDSSTTVQSSATVPTAVTHSMHPESSSSSTSTGQMPTMSTSSVSNAVSTMGSTNMNKGILSFHNSSSVTGNYSAMSCPEFDCTTDCSVQFMNATMNHCPHSYNFCEIMTQNTSYSVKCSASCGVSCGNSTLANCSWKCCNTTSCLNDALLDLTRSPSTTVAAITSTTTATTTKATAPSTQANNGKKCHSIKCEGTACYKPISTSMLCLVGQDYCMLKKTTSGSIESWQAGCSEDCRKMAVCSTSVTTCYLECCNATSTASCLKLTGEVNMPSSATRGPHSPALLIASLLLFWILRVFT
ncbi:uncharacterized protein LOC130085731 [Rhinichthys klamathensis goyatoka]|uniref:uncharacterized protein LOC130085731 n=1 Tax=Rhinichthys klamathensis goyatoka TaxID=3034132 RepID=UPI0024B61994|nr:uncharacterized protein LOC130085731 [Rhinichthys klamathensis goyatoka]